MSLFDHVVEQKLAQAIAAGELDGLPGSGRPLELEDLSRVDEELRAGYLLLKNAGVLPEEMELAKELLSLGDLLRACVDPEERASLDARRRALALRYDILVDRVHRR